MKKITFYLLGILTVLVLTITSCSEAKKSASLSTQEKQITAIGWKAAGYRLNGQALSTKPPKFDITFLTTGIPNVPSTLTVNNNTMPALWTVANSVLSLTYPNGTSGATGITLAAQSININLSDTELAFKNSGTSTITLFGIIPLAANTEIYFNSTGDANTSVTTVTNSDLTSSTWTSSGVFSGTTNAQLQTVGGTYNFKTNFGVNTLTISGVPAPVTWSLTSATLPSTLTMIYPNSAGQVETKTFTVKTLNASSLVLTLTDSSRSFFAGATGTGTTLYTVADLVLQPEWRFTK